MNKITTALLVTTLFIGSGCMPSMAQNVYDAGGKSGKTYWTKWKKQKWTILTSKCERRYVYKGEWVKTQAKYISRFRKC